ncbi:MAG: MFS transporter [Candidatus Thermoplasmatota archaeon]|jgi:MFS family permease|nr:MFS transporter [Candidatus Thermoplasmatota archaeon]MCL5786995.1 MFS transporter [Candidatus Thermoplasmatota archaeon]
MQNFNIYDSIHWNKFLKYLMGRNLIRVAYFIFNIFFVWRTIVAYNSVFLAGLIPAFSLFGYLIVIVPEGHILDRHNRGTVFRMSSILMVFTYLLLVYSDSLAIVYAVALISSILSSINSDAFNTILKETVTEDEIQHAVSLSQGTNAVSELSGIIVGGILLYLPFQFLFVTLFLLPVISLLFGLGKTLNRAGMVDKYGFKGAYRIILVLVPFLMLSLLLNGLFISLDVYGSGLIHIILHGSPLDYSLFIAGFPFGIVIGSLFTGKFSAIISRTGTISALLVPMGIVLLLIALSRIIYIDIALGILLGAIVIFINIGLQTIFMKAIPDGVMGRVNSLVTIFSIGGSPLMAALFSILSNYFYFPYIMAAAGICAVVVSLPAFKVLRNLPERVSNISKLIESEAGSVLN